MKKILLFIAFVFYFYPSFLSANTTDVWDGVSSSTDWYYLTPYSSTFYIHTAAELKGLSELTSPSNYVDFTGKTIILLRNIDLGNHEWEPIGCIADFSDYVFNGIFDGNGKTISGVRITKSNMNYSRQLDYGFFGGISISRTIQNLTLEGNVELNTSTNQQGVSISVGGFVGGNWGQIINCNSKINIDVTFASFNQITVGAISGGNSGVIKNSTAEGKVKATVGGRSVIFIGGISGQNFDKGLISECKTTLPIEILAGIGGRFAGIAGYNYGKIDNCLFDGSIQDNSQEDWHVSISGIANNESIVENCLNIGNLTSNRNNPNIYAISEKNTNSFYRSDIPNIGEGTALTIEQLKNGEAFQGFDLSIWTFEYGKYPYLSFTQPKFDLTIKTEQGEIIMTLPKDKSIELGLSGNDAWKIDQLIWNDTDITESYQNGILKTPEIIENSVLTIVFKSLTDVKTIKASSNIKISTTNNSISIRNIEKGNIITLYSINGKTIYNAVSNSDVIKLDNLQNGVYIIKIDDETFKVAL